MKSVIVSHNQFAFTYYYFMTSKGNRVMAICAG